MLQDMIGRLIEIGGFCGMEMNLKKKEQIYENFKTTILTKNNDRTKTNTECGIFGYQVDK